MACSAEKLSLAKAKRKRGRRPGSRNGAAPKTTRRLVWVCKLREQRLFWGLSLRDVATNIGMSIANLFDLENGTDPQLTTADRLAGFFGVEIQELWPRRVEQ